MDTIALETTIRKEPPNMVIEQMVDHRLIDLLADILVGILKQVDLD